jgi:IS30 family transposase
MAGQRRRLTVFDRSTIDLRLRDGWGLRAIARSLDRSPGMISDEVCRHGGVVAYQADAAAAQAAVDRRWSGRQPALAQHGAPFGRVAELVRLGWSPEQISGRRKRMEAVWSSHLAYRCRPRRSTRRYMPCRAANCAAS